MARQRKSTKRESPGARATRRRKREARKLYRRANRLAERGEHEQARNLYESANEKTTDARLRALAQNDLACLAAANDDAPAAVDGFRAALEADPACEPARLNLALLEADLLDEGPDPTSPHPSPPPQGGRGQLPAVQPSAAPQAAHAERGQTIPFGAPRAPSTSAQGASGSSDKVAILSFLFNWPSTGGGIVHIVELAKFLAKAGYEVRHIHARYEPWGIGRVEAPLPIASEAIEFDDATWNVPTIQARFREAVDSFAPDWVIVMAAWNFKPLMAQAVRGYPYFLRFQALECLCPLNNLRLLPEGNGRFSQCPRHQLATPAFCYQCLAQNSHLSGSLHQAERHLSGVGSPEYDQALRQALWEAEAVLVLNPITEAMISPFARRTEVVPWGMDPARFPEPDEPPEYSPKLLTTLLFAGLTDELIKGFHVLREACRLLWQKRRDFELVATAEPMDESDEFTRYVGWASQEDLPRHYAEADIVVVSTIAQDGLSRTSVEAMASGRPVVGSRIGGVPFTVVDGATGLLFEPGNTADLAAKLETLLDDSDLRRRMGALGRRCFEEHFTWDSVIERHYRPLLKVPAAV